MALVGYINDKINVVLCMWLVCIRDVLPAARKGAAAALGVLPAGLLAGWETAVLGVLAATVQVLYCSTLVASTFMWGLPGFVVAMKPMTFRNAL